MSTAMIQTTPTLLTEVSEFLASAPSRQKILKYRLSKAAQQRARDLLAKLKTDHLTPDEKRELDHFECIDLLMGLVKARIRASQVPQS